MVSTQLTEPIESRPMHILAQIKRLSFAASLSLILTPAHNIAFAGGHSVPINQWYEALESANAEKLKPLLAEGAEIVLQDLDITQTRDEFLNSMDEWKDAIEGGALRHKILSDNDNRFVVEVCYDFAENDILMKETFSMADGKIAKQVQSQLGDSC